MIKDVDPVGEEGFTSLLDKTVKIYFKYEDKMIISLIGIK